jgi:hypothetical protein
VDDDRIPQVSLIVQLGVNQGTITMNYVNW